MTFNPNAKPENSFERELIPEGPHLARCVRVVEIGKHHNPKYDKTQNKVIIVFSLPNVIMNFGEIGDKQAFISHPYGITISNFEKSDMYEYTSALDPTGSVTDLGGFLNKPCQISIKHQAREGKSPYARIDGVAPMLPGLEVPELDTDPFWFQWDNPDPEIWNKLNDFTKNLIQEAVNYPDSLVQRVAEGEVSGNDIPM
tara:strand:- start:6261 stop:6857 length:597 start_codon:yes stop_codon:yes gene_type:complete